MTSRPNFILAALLLLATTPCQAASFDCAKATTPTEKLICSDATLERLDEALATAYRDAYRAAADKHEVKVQQRRWLKRRDRCQDRDCLVVHYQRRIEALTADKSGYDWLREYAGKSTNALVWDKRFGDFVARISPRTKQDYALGEGNLAGALSGALGGPPELVSLSKDRYITFSACTPHFCPEKGFVWVDLDRNTAIAAVLHYDSRRARFMKHPLLLVFSRDVVSTSLPARFTADLTHWLTASGKNNIKKVFIDAQGNAENL